jgi:hypothetical protein
LHAGLGLPVVDGGQQLAGAHLIAGLDRDRGHAAGGLRRDGALLDRLDHAVVLESGRHRLRARLHHSHLDRRGSPGEAKAQPKPQGDDQQRKTDRHGGNTHDGNSLDTSGSIYTP